jgi:enoyl-CoA hydratase
MLSLSKGNGALIPANIRTCVEKRWGQYTSFNYRMPKKREEKTLKDIVETKQYGEYRFVTCEKHEATEGAIARITLNRPEKLNALDLPGDGGIHDEFWAALDEIANDDDVKVLIIRGAGRAFCSGFDLSRPYRVYQERDGVTGKERPSQRRRLNLDRQWTEDNQKVLLYPKITIAQVHGHCIGEGSTLAEQCDITIVADDAKISHAEQRLGFAGSGENLVPLFAMVGYKRARAMVLLGESITGKEAAEIGWATKSVPLDKLEEEVNRIATSITLLPRDGISIGKASNHMILDILGYTQGWAHAYITHTMVTNMKYAPGEFIWVKQREETGTKTSFHNRDKRFEELG